MSKLLSPVSASIPLNSNVFDFSGKLPLASDPRSELVTHGGLPRINSEPGFEPSRSIHSKLKKFDVNTAARPDSISQDRYRLAATTCRELRSTPISRASGKACAAALRNDPVPQVGSKMTDGTTPRCCRIAHTATARGSGVWKSPNSRVSLLIDSAIQSI